MTSTMTSTMQAQVVTAFGEPLQLTDVAVPTPAADEVLVEVYAAGVNPVDWKTSAGGGIAWRIKTELPWIMGWDVAGRVAAVGAEVSAFQPGDAVYGLIRFPEVGSAYAEYATAPATDLAAKPATLSWAEAAATPLAALTAWQVLTETAGLQPGQRVLIHAAAGGVGHIAVQLAKHMGAYVIGTASPANHGFLRELGCDDVIDYTSQRFEDAASEIDVVVDCVGGLGTRSLAVLRAGGVYASILGLDEATQAAAQAQNLRAGAMLVRPEAQQLKALAELIDAGTLRIVVRDVLPLAEANEAHQRGATSRGRGKIALEVRSDA